MLTPWPPGPEAQKRSTRMSFSSTLTSTSSASGRTATVAADVWMRPAALGRWNALHAVDAALVLEARVGAVALDDRRDRLDAADAGVVPVDDLDLPAPPLGVPLVHPEELGREERRLVAARARPDLEKDVTRVVRVLREEEDLQRFLDGGEPLGQRGPLGRRHLVELVARRQGLGQLARAVELALELAVLLHLSDDRLELGQGLLGIPDRAVVLHEGGVREAGPDLVVLAADVFESFEHEGLSAVSKPRTAGRISVGPLQSVGGGRKEPGGDGVHPRVRAARPRRRRPSSRSACGSARRGRRSRPASACP